MTGWSRTVLRINLTTGPVTKHLTTTKDATLFLGAGGLGVQILTYEVNLRPMLCFRRTLALISSRFRVFMKFSQVAFVIRIRWSAGAGNQSVAAQRDVFSTCVLNAAIGVKHHTRRRLARQPIQHSLQCLAHQPHGLRRQSAAARAGSSPRRYRLESGALRGRVPPR